jgi:hypothetical protein
VFRFDPEDTLVFRVRFENDGENEVIYQPQRIAARVGQNVYYASIADASGIILNSSIEPSPKRTRCSAKTI